LTIIWLFARVLKVKKLDIICKKIDIVVKWEIEYI